jgi:hypothetical protein
MAPPPAPAIGPWRTTMRERHLGVPRDAAWARLVEQLGTNAADLSVEAPWRHVRRLTVPGVDRVEQTLTIRDDGEECLLAWCVGLTAEVDDPAADALLARLGDDGEALLDQLAAAGPP